MAMRPGRQSMGNIHLDRKIICRVVEARNLNLDKVKTVDPFTVVQLDGKEERTPVVNGNSNPFWAEEFLFEDFDTDFRQLGVTVMNKGEKEDVAFGQILFPKAIVVSGHLEEEQWFALNPVDAENSVSGDLRVKIAYNPPKNNITKHTVSVTVVQGRNLMPRTPDGKANPYVVLHLLPDLRLKSTQQSKPVAGSLDPTFKEVFVFMLDEWKPDLEIHLSVWHDTNTGDDVFMGHSSIPLSFVSAQPKTDKWYTLLPKPGHIANLYTLMERNKKKGKGITDVTKQKMFTLALQTADLEAAMAVKVKKAHKFVDLKLNSLSYCGHCSGIMWAQSAQMQCKECRVNCHVKCTKYIASNCGTMSLIRLKIKYSMTPVLMYREYENFLQIISKDNFALSVVLGKIIQEREEAAKLFVSIFDERQNILGFINASVAQEFAVALDANTLFRANSMASKAVDVYQKFVGMTYLKSTLGPIIQSIISAELNCEVDPSRLKKTDKIDQNWKNLLGYMRAITHSIFTTSHNMPPQLRSIFMELRAQAGKKFPNDTVVIYTSVAGFIFLRFFAPAILGPRLFGLTDTYVSDTVSRTFTLLAKTLQNLANLVQFGGKEPFMNPMNEFIRSKLEEMQNFLTEISSSETGTKRSSQIATKVVLTSTQLSKLSARLYEHFVKNSEKVLSECTTDQEQDNVVELFKAMEQISTKVDEAWNGLPQVGSAKITLANEENTPLSVAAFSESQDLSIETVGAQKSKTTQKILGALKTSETMAERKTSSPKTPLRSMFSPMPASNENSDVSDLGSQPVTPTANTSSQSLAQSPAVVSPHQGSDIDKLKLRTQLQRPSAFRQEAATSSAQQLPSVPKQDSSEEEKKAQRLALQSFSESTVAKPVPGKIEVKAKAQPQVVEVRSPLRQSTEAQEQVASPVIRAVAQKRNTPSSSKDNLSGEPQVQPRPPSTQRPTDASVRSSTSSALGAALDQVFPDYTNSKPVSPNPYATLNQKSQPQSPAKMQNPYRQQDPLVKSQSQPSVQMQQPIQQQPPVQQQPPAQLQQMQPPAQQQPPVQQQSAQLPLQQFPSSTIRSSRTTAKGTPADKAARLAAMSQLQSAMGVVDMAATGTVLPQCDQCFMPINQESEVRKAFGKCYHASHFVCSSCQTPLSDQGTLVNGKLFCEHHNPNRQQSGTLCADCELPITDVLVDALGKKWHTTCFTCQACGIQLTGNFVAFEGRPFCKEDYYKRAGLQCGVCGENIEAEFIEIYGRKYHLNCKKCDHCQKSLAGRHYFSLNGSIMCIEHQAEFSNCRRCNKSIDGQVLVALKNQYRYHPEHFNCSRCNKNLINLQYYEKEDTPFCQNCWLQVSISQVRQHQRQ